MPGYLVKPYFWMYLWECFRRDQHLNWWNEESTPPTPLWVGLIPSAGGCTEQKGGGREDGLLSLCLSAELKHPSSARSTRGSQASDSDQSPHLTPSDFQAFELQHQPPQVSSLQVVDHGASQPPQSHEPIPYKFISRCDYIPLGSASLENPDQSTRQLADAASVPLASGTGDLIRWQPPAPLRPCSHPELLPPRDTSLVFSLTLTPCNVFLPLGAPGAFEMCHSLIPHLKDASILGRPVITYPVRPLAKGLLGFSGDLWRRELFYSHIPQTSCLLEPFPVLSDVLLARCRDSSKLSFSGEGGARVWHHSNDNPGSLTH